MACQSNQLGGIVSEPRETLNAGKVRQTVARRWPRRLAKVCVHIFVAPANSIEEN
jgi:hypothetical protein